MREPVEQQRGRGTSHRPAGLQPSSRRVYAHDPLGNRLESLQPDPKS